MNAAPNMKLEPPGWSCHGQCYRMARAKPTRGSTPRWAVQRLRCVNPLSKEARDF